MKNENVLVVTNAIDPVYGGPTFSGSNSAIAMARSGSSVTLIAPATKESLKRGAQVISRLRTSGVKVIIFNETLRKGEFFARWSLNIKLLLWLAWNYRSFGVVISRSPWTASSFFHAFLAWFPGGPINLMSPHESFTEFDIRRTGGEKKQNFKRRVGQFIINRMDAIIFSSPLEKKESEKVFKVSKSTVIYHPVHVECAEKIDRDRNITWLGYFGRLHAKKNVALIIRALEKLPQNIRLAIGGTGEEEGNLKALAYELGVSDRVLWLGLQSPSQKGAFFESIDIGVFPSDFECFGMSIAEALCSGVPVITTRLTGISEIIEKFDCGIIVTKSEDEIVSAVEQISAAKGGLELRRVAAKEAGREFNLEVHADRFRDIIRELDYNKGCGSNSKF